jgi:hypothetical protein
MWRLYIRYLQDRGIIDLPHNERGAWDLLRVFHRTTRQAGQLFEVGVAEVKFANLSGFGLGVNHYLRLFTGV